MNLDDLEQALAAMTPGEWTAERGDAWDPLCRDDAAGIATLRNVATELVAVARAAEVHRKAWHIDVAQRDAQAALHSSLRALDAALARLPKPE